MIEKLGAHYSMTNPATVYDEEALTALELAGRTASKVNEIIDSQNNLEKSTAEQLENQNEEIKKQETNIIPSAVKTEMITQINNGTFANEINRFAGDLRKQVSNSEARLESDFNELEDTLGRRVDNLIGKVVQGSTTMDAEVIDIRTRANGVVYETAGNTVRAIDRELTKLTEDNNGVVILHEDLSKMFNWTTGNDFSETGIPFVCDHESFNMTIGTDNSTNAVGFATKLFSAKYPDNKIYLELDFECNIESCLQIYLATNYFSNDAERTCYQMKPSFPAGHYLFEIRPDELPHTLNTIWFVHNGNVAGVNEYDYTFNKIKVYQNLLKDAGFEGEAVTDYLKELAEKNDDLKEEINGLSGSETIISGTDSTIQVFTGASWGAENKTENSLTWTGLDNAGLCTTELKYDYTKKVHLSFDIEQVSNNPDAFIGVYLAQTFDSNLPYVGLATYSESGHYELEFDPAYYVAHHDLDPKYIWILSHVANDGSGEMYQRTTVTNLKVYQSLLKDNGYTDNLAKAIVEVGKRHIVAKNDASFLITPNGERYIMQVNENGEFLTTPVNPNKAVYVGNSLLAGMSASDYKNTYHNLCSDVFKSMKPSFTFTFCTGATWESATTKEEQDNWLNETLAPLLSADTELIVVQLGDNVHNETIPIFEEGIKNLVQFARTKCQKARVVWVGAWYQTQTKMDIMNRACGLTGATFIDIWDLNTVENQARLGESWMDANGTTHLIESEGAATHPSDRGMKAIANRILYGLGVIDGEDYFEI